MMPSTASPTTRRIARRTGRNLAIAVLFSLATCNEQAQAPESPGLTPARKAMGVVPPTEAASWQRSLSLAAPEGRFLQAVAFDETRKLVVMFGGESRAPNGGVAQPTQDMWEWAPTTGAWTIRPASGAVPAARAGAAMVFDPVRNKMVLSGGRTASGYNYEDWWEWDPTTGTWTDRSEAGAHPSARAQQGMLYEKSTGKILLYGGGRSSASSSDGTSASASLGDTWELDPATNAWTALSPAASPSVRHDFGLAWDSARNKAVLFGGMQIDIPGATGVPKQDTWEWDPAAHTWTERTAAGSKPSQRYGHAMAFDGGRNKVVVFGGWDMTTTAGTNDLWDWDATTGAWTELLTGTESGVPKARTYASMVWDGVRSRLELVAGQVAYSPDGSGGYYGLVGSNEVWELNPTTVTFTDRSTAYQVPNARAYHAMAYNPVTGKVYVFGGVDPMWKGSELADLWEWDGANWTKVVTEQSPPARLDGAMAYDPARKSLILFGGNSWTKGTIPNDTWEWSGTTRQWTQLVTSGGPTTRWGHAMVTDTARKKILLFGGSTNTAGEIWEWDGATLTWTDRTPVASSSVPVARNYPVLGFDEARGKLVVYDGSRSPSVAGQSTSAFWEWDVVTGGWALRDPGDSLPEASNIYAVYDSVRRRLVFLTDASVNNVLQTWELDAKSATWYARSLASTPGSRFRGAMTYDSGRRVAVVFGGTLNSPPGGTANDTWVYAVTNLANGEGCTAAAAANCGSGNCVDGVCCESAGCSGACKSCNVSGSEGTCVLAGAGTEVPGSCADGQACDGTGICKSKNGQACSAASGCASGFCVDGVCCDVGCTATCMACNLAGRVGKCTAHAVGTDPNNECGQGTGACKSTCDGVGACSYPLGGVSCGSCLTCDGAGTCSRADPTCAGGSGGSVIGKGGMGGSVMGGAGGKPTSGGAGGSGSGGTAGGSGGNGGSRNGGSSGGGGSGGTSTPGSGGTINGSGGTIAPGTGGTISGGGGSASRDAGSPRGGAGGSTGGSTGNAFDGGSVKRDSGGLDADGGLTAKLQRGGCSCEVGRGDSPGASGWPWMLLVGTGLLVRRLRRRQP